ncbi:hypothetical protein EAG_06504 [Camponotus floridanus]|uniref:Uncharacterized protein n=1 Tax=Camponotus floridanus TaxID=104421 RepID=E2A2Q4_CAMFO|nr:hypothetical protein EAG_06504 [Camponotus floridanus]
MFAGLGQEYRRVFGDSSATPATSSGPPMTGPFVAQPNRRDDYAASAQDEDTRDRSDTPPVIKKARLYTEGE